jgi:hypothetical protein
MLCYVNDLYDYRLINQGVYKQFREHFNPKVAFNFVMDMFKQTAEDNNVKISIQFLPCVSMPIIH